MDDTLRHEMAMTTTNDDEAYFECTVADCGRKVLLDRATLALKVHHTGHTGVLHRGSTAGGTAADIRSVA